MSEKTKLEKLRIYSKSDEWIRIKAYCETKFNEYTNTIKTSQREYAVLEYTVHDQKDDKIEVYEDVLGMVQDEDWELFKEDIIYDIQILKPHLFEVFDEYGRSMDTNIFSHLDMIRFRRNYYGNLSKLVDIIIELKMPKKEAEMIMNPLQDGFSNDIEEYKPIEFDSVLPEDIIQPQSWATL